MKTLLQRLYHGDFTAETLPWRLYHRDFITETYCGNLTMGILLQRLYTQRLYCRDFTMETLLGKIQSPTNCTFLTDTIAFHTVLTSYDTIPDEG